MARRRAEARLPDNGFSPDVMLSSLCLQHSGITPNQKSMILSSTGGGPSLEVMRRHMRRILQPCGVELKQDVLVVKGDAPKTQAVSSGSVANDGSDARPAIGDATVASKKKKKKQEKGKTGSSSILGGHRDTPNQINPRTGYRKRCYGCGSEFHLLPQ